MTMNGHRVNWNLQYYVGLFILFIARSVRSAHIWTPLKVIELFFHYLVYYLFSSNLCRIFINRNLTYSLLKRELESYRILKIFLLISAITWSIIQYIHWLTNKCTEFFSEKPKRKVIKVLNGNNIKRNIYTYLKFQKKTSQKV